MPNYIQQLINRLKTRIENVFLAPGQEINYWAGLIRYQVQLWRFCGRRLRENNSMAMSAALSFRTIFALVPILVLSLMILRVVVSPEESREFIRLNLNRAGISEKISIRSDEVGSNPVIEEHAVGDNSINSEMEKQTEDNVLISSASAEMADNNLIDEIMKLVDRVDQKLTFQRLGPIGFILLIWTAITLITTIERSLNRIYRAPQSRALVRRIMLYWSVLTLVPVIMFVTIFLEEKILNAIESVTVLSSMLRLLGWIGPIVVGVITLAALYCLLPNTRVSLRSALGGALVAYPLWLVGKWLFVLYVQYFVRTGSLYGTLGLLPIFLMWLNISWTIFLFGAELSHTASNLKRMQSAEIAARIHLSPLDSLAAALIIARPYLAGKGPVPFDHICSELDLPYDSVQNLIDRLADNRVICAVGAETRLAFVLARPAEQIPLGDVLEINRNYFDQTAHCNTEEIQALIKRVLRQMGDTLDKLSLSAIINEENNHEKFNA